MSNVYQQSASAFAGKLRMAATDSNYVGAAIKETLSVEKPEQREILRLRAEQVLRDAIRVADLAREWCVYLESYRRRY